MKITVINGPNLNMLGLREPEIYGNKSYDDLMQKVKNFAKNHDVDIKVLQSNYEGQLVDWIQQGYFDKVDGIIINPAGYTHTSIALRDAILAIAPLPVVEVHLSEIEKRESFRQYSYCKDVCIAQITGKGIDGYFDAIELLMQYLKT